VKPSPLDVLLFLAENGAAAAPVRASTTAIAERVHASQQTVSRWVRELQKDGLVQRKRGGLSITAQGLRTLTRYAVKPSARREFNGVVFSGFRDGARFMPLYAPRIRFLLGYEPYAGTLNIKLAVPHTLSGGMRIPPFETRGVQCGGIALLPCIVGGKSRGAIVLPERTHYGNNVLEIIAPVRLRRSLRLRNGSAVTVQLLENK